MNKEERKIKKNDMIQRPYSIKKHDGEVNTNTSGSKMIVIETINSNNIIIEFEDGYITHDSYSNFKKGLIKNPYDRTIYGVGYLGDEYIKNKSLYKLKSYSKWRDMMYRCYSGLESMEAYKECVVCDEWQNYSNFKKWFDDNYYEIEGENVHLDKDILVYNNKIYSPETCIFVPQIFNQIFQSHKKNNKGLKTGVKKEGNKYFAQISNNLLKKREYSKKFLTEDEAYDEYVCMKKKYLLDVLSTYYGKIPIEVFNKLKLCCINYKPM